MDKKEIIRVLYEEVGNEGRLELIDEIACADYVEHHPFPGQAGGIAGLRERASHVRAALSPHFTLEHVIFDGDKVAVMWRNRGTQLADWMGVPASGKSFDIEGVDIYQFRDGLLAEHWHVVDVFTMMVQLGGIPAPAGAPA